MLKAFFTVVDIAYFAIFAHQNSKLVPVKLTIKKVKKMLDNGFCVS
jgi:hypothetical protein